MISTTRFLTLLLVASVIFALPTVAAEPDADEGTIIQIGPDRPAAGARQGVKRGIGRQPRPWGGPPPVVVDSRYWIGIEGSIPSPALRSQLDLDVGEGWLINRIMPESPAEKGKLEVYDVITKINGDPIDSIHALAEQVAKQGERKGRLAINIIRKGRPRTVWVAPAERPVREPAAPQGPRFQQGKPVQQFGVRRQVAFQGGVLISISKNGQGPTKIIVKRGGETWEVEGNDAEALEALPEDLRPRVQQMLGQPGRGLQVARPLGMEEQLQRMQQQLENRQLQRGNGRFPGNFEQPVEQAQPSEIELPVE